MERRSERRKWEERSGNKGPPFLIRRYSVRDKLLRYRRLRGTVRHFYHLSSIITAAAPQYFSTLIELIITGRFGCTETFFTSEYFADARLTVLRGNARKKSCQYNYSSSNEINTSQVHKLKSFFESTENKQKILFLS